MKQDTSNSRTSLGSAARLNALASLGLMDSPTEEVFDRAVRLATRVLGTDVGLLSLVDGERQFFKAQFGLPEPYASARETPLSHSFCQHVVTSDAPLVVGNAREDDRVKTNLAIRDLDVIAYLGVPVHDREGHVLGSFCAIQSTPRDWTDDERTVLDDIAAGIESELALRSALHREQANARSQTAIKNRFSLALASGEMGTYDLDLVSQVTDWDAELFALWGVPADTANPFEVALQRIHPDDLAEHEAAFEASMDPDGDGLYSVEMRVLRDGNDNFWVASTGLVSFEDKKPVRMVGTVRDISKRKHAEEHMQLLTGELNHRVKNLFAITNGIVSVTARESETTREMADTLRSRIVSLSTAHDLVRPAITLDHSTAADTDLQTLALTILGPHCRAKEQVELSGPHVSLGPENASSLALVLHELATNAGKYGALSEALGVVFIEWSLTDAELVILWTEKNGPAITRSSGEAGFGSTLIDLTVKRKMMGTYDMDWAANGLRCTITLPWG